jgi:peroxiredoxin Q/BCP
VERLEVRGFATQSRPVINELDGYFSSGEIKLHVELESYHEPVLKEGDKAPAFDLESDEGGRFSLKDFFSRGNKTLVLYFYPRDNTPGCTRQAQGFSAAKKAIEAAGASVVGVSRDSLKSHGSFREKCNLSITLLSDPDLEVHKAYGAWGMKKMYGRDVEGVLRTTFIIDKGKITQVFPNVKVDGHADAILAALKPSPKAPAKAPKKKAAAPKAPAKKKKKATAKKK